jgi:hypothetical protein
MIHKLRETTPTSLLFQVHYQCETNLFILLHVLWILLQNDKALEHTRKRKILLRRQLGTFPIPNENRRRMSLEPRNGLGSSSLSDRVDSLANSDGDGKGSQLLVEGNKESRSKRRRKIIKQPMIIPQDDYCQTEFAGDVQ